MKLSAFNLFRLIVVAILVAIAAVLVIRAYYRHLQIQEYKDRNIYEIVAMNPKKEEGKTRLTAYYMICEPGGSLEEVKAQIAPFLSEQKVLEQLVAVVPEERRENPQFELVFIRPTKSWPIGKLSQDKEQFDLWVDMPVASVSVAGGQCTYTYYQDDGNSQSCTEPVPESCEKRKRG